MKEDGHRSSEDDLRPEYSCEGCGGAIPEGMSEGLCPACLLSAGLETEAPLDESSDSSSAETLEDSGQAVGKTIGRYKLLQEIGEGGFGTVYLARQTEPVKRQVALKVIKAGMDTREVIARFEGERQALALMDHPNIAKVHDGGTTPNGRPYFVMELVKGVPITKYCDDENLDTKARLALFKDVCAAVQHAHQKGIIHRDLKPSNILVSPHDGKPVIKVIDFGIAKAISMELTEKTVFTELGRMIGTPQYMSPEQAELNALDVDTRSDIYSLGVVLYELLTGTTPLDAKELRSAAYAEIQRMIREETPAKPSTRISSLRAQRKSTKSTLRTPTSGSSQDLDWITMRALEKDRTRRYETANALAQDIERHLREEPVLAGPPSATYRIGKFVRRNRGKLLSGALAGAALLVGLAVAGGVWLNSEWEDRERIAGVEQQASVLIDQAERLMERNAASANYDDAASFLQAREVTEQIKLLGDLEEAGDEFRERRDRLLDAVTSEERDRNLIAGIEEALMISIGAGKGDPSQSTSEEMGDVITQAFVAHEMNPAVASVPEMVAMLESRRENVRDRILAGFSFWSALLQKSSLESANRLDEVVALADQDPWRARMRIAMYVENHSRLEELIKLDKLTGQSAMTLVIFGRSLLENGLTTTAENLLRGAQRSHPVSFWTNFLLGTVLSDMKLRRGKESAEGASIGFARPLLRSPESDKAIGFLRAAVAARPEAAGAWMNLGSSLHAAGYPEEAIACHREGIRLKPDFAQAHYNLGVGLQNQGKLDDAIGSYRESIRLKPENPKVHFNLGKALAKQGIYDEAIKSFRQAIRLRPDYFKAHYDLAVTLNLQGNYDEAMKSCKEAIRLNPDSFAAHYRLGNALISLDKFDEAVASLQEAIRLNSDWAEAHYCLGVTLGIQGEHESATESYRETIRLKPDHAQAHNNLGSELAKQGKHDEAIESYREAIRLDPNDAKAHRNLGRELFDRYQFEEAITILRRAISLAPESIQEYALLLPALLVTGRLPEVQSLFDTAPPVVRNGALMRQLSSGAQMLLEKETHITGILREKGAVHPSIAPLLEEMMGLIPPPSSDAARLFWQEHREEVAAALETAAIQMISIPKPTGDLTPTTTDRKILAQDLRKQLVAGAYFSDLEKKHSKHGVKHYNMAYASGEQGPGETLVNAAFAIRPGGISQVIEIDQDYVILRVEKRSPGKADNFWDKGVEEAAKNLALEQRRKEWNINYLKMLQQRIADEESGNSRATARQPGEPVLPAAESSGEEIDEGTTIVVKSIRVRYIGPATVDEQRILSAMRTRVGDVFSQAKAKEDVDSIFLRGDVQKVDILEEPIGSGNLIVEVRTRAVLSDISFINNSMVSTDKLRKKAGLKIGDSIDKKELSDAESKIEAYYNERGFPDIEIRSSVKESDRPGYPAVVFDVWERLTCIVRNIRFEGNEAMTSAKLRPQLKTKVKGGTDSGVIHRKEIEADRERIVTYYRDNGYLDADVVEIRQERLGDSEVDIVMVVEEGSLYKVSSVTFDGISKADEAKLRPGLKQVVGQVCSQRNVKADQEQITTYFRELGNAETAVRVSTKDTGEKLLGVTYWVVLAPKAPVGKMDFPVAELVPGEPGVVFSPYQSGKKVSIEGFEPGDFVKCPWSGKPFRVPGATEKPKAGQPVKPAISPSRGVAPPASTKLAYGQPTETPGIVISPHAGKKVRVGDLARGQRVECPYTGKIFLVP